MVQNVGIVGTGWVASRHVAALSRMSEVRVAAIAGRNLTKARGLAAMAKGPGASATIYEDWGDMLDRERLDALFILLPPFLHGELETACAARVPAVLVEKPIATDLATAHRALTAFEAAGTFAAAAYMNRCSGSVMRARELFQAPSDSPILVEGRWLGPIPPPVWWRDRSLSGGQFVEQCTHLVDIARFVAGEIIEVSAFSASGFIDDVEGFATDDAMIVNARFASGALARFSTGCFPRPGLVEDTGIGLLISSRTTRCKLSGWGMALHAEFASGRTESLLPEVDIFEVEDRLFLRAAATGEWVLFPSSYADAIETLRVTLAANESAATGQTIRLGSKA
jgi:myo-inositol 2-dehydrogenase/D-chiro-inositol 1-dehydrogenase